MGRIDEVTVQEQKVYEHYKAIEAENFHLNKQLQKGKKENDRLRHLIRVWKSRAQGSNKKSHYTKRKSGNLDERN